MNIKTILMSRFKKDPVEEWVNERRSICLKCSEHSFNKEVSTKIKVIRFFSDLYSRICGREQEDNLGNCGYCGCSTYYMTAEPENSCSAEKQKWKSIYIPNKKQK